LAQARRCDLSDVAAPMPALHGSPPGLGVGARMPEERPPTMDSPPATAESGVFHQSRVAAWPTASRHSEESEAAKRTQKLLQLGRLAIDRLPERGSNAYMGCTWRSAITGEIKMTYAEGWPDFQLVDIWKRDWIEGTLQEFLDDRYLFLPIPLIYRTWLYHGLVHDRKVTSSGGSEHAMVLTALEESCIDVPLTAGRWSPLICYAPMAFVLCFTGDMVVTLMGIGMFLLLYFLTVQFNTPALYRYLRVACVVPRLFFVGFVVTRISWQSTLSLLASILAFGIMGIDVFYGDLEVLRCQKFLCHYELLKALPNRVFICRRHGGASIGDNFGSHGRVHESITGLGTWSSHLILIADINGILAELRPLTTQDVLDMYDEQSSDTDKLFPWCYVGLDVYGMKRPDFSTFDCSYKDLVEKVEGFERQLPMDSMLRPRGQGEPRPQLSRSCTPEAWKQPLPPKLRPPQGRPKITPDVIETNL